MVSIVRKIILSLVSLSQIKSYGIESAKRFYRYIRYNDKKLCIETPRFNCDGAVRSKFNPDVLQLPVPVEAISELLKIDNFVKDKFVLPSGAPAEWRESTSPYKALNEALHDHIYLKLDEKFKVYNFDREEIAGQDLASGEYKAIIKIKGIYYGPHGGLDKLASLQMSIIQLMYKPDFDEDCLFLPPDSPSSPSNLQPSPSPRQLQQRQDTIKFSKQPVKRAAATKTKSPVAKKTKVDLDEEPMVISSEFSSSDGD